MDDQDIRKVEAVTLVVTKADDSGEAEYLLAYNGKWGAYTLPISKIRENEPPQEAAQRILDIELGLKSLDVGKPEYLDTISLSQSSNRTKELTDYTYHAFHVPLSEASASHLRTGTDKKLKWFTRPELIHKSVSPTVTPTLFNLFSTGKLPFLQRPSHFPTLLVKSICDGLVEVVRYGLRVLREQTDAGEIGLFDKADATVFDKQAQDVLFNKTIEMANRVAGLHSTPMRLRLQGEEGWIVSEIGKNPRTELVITVDPCDGSTNFKGPIVCGVPSHLGRLLPTPDTGISIAAQLYPYGRETGALRNHQYVAGVATDVQTGTVYSAYMLEDCYICRINDLEVRSSHFPLMEVSPPKINLPFYSHTGYELLKELMVRLRQKIGTKRIYPGRCRASIVDMIRMLAGDCEAMVDVRALQPDGGSCLKPYDVCGMVPFFQGLGWSVCDEKGNAIAWEAYNEPVCLIVSRSKRLCSQIVEVLAEVRMP